MLVVKEMETYHSAMRARTVQCSVFEWRQVMTFLCFTLFLVVFSRTRVFSFFFSLRGVLRTVIIRFATGPFARPRIESNSVPSIDFFFVLSIRLWRLVFAGCRGISLPCSWGICMARSRGARPLAGGVSDGSHHETSWARLPVRFE